MQYASLGNTKVKVSRIGFGGAPAGLENYLRLSNPNRKETKKKVLNAIEKAIELGINYFDTAPVYGHGLSEKIFGEALEGVEKNIFLASKVSIGVKNNHARKSLYDTLKRLKIDRLDLLQIHGQSYTKKDVDLVLKKGGMLDELLSLKNEGMIRFIGFSTEDNNDAVYQFINCGKFDVMQINYNFICQHPFEPSRAWGSLYEAEKAGLGIVTMRTATSGTFQRWIKMVNPNNTFDYFPALIQFVLSNPLVDVALIGMRNPEEVIQNVELCGDIANRIDISAVHKRFL